MSDAEDAGFQEADAAIFATVPSSLPKQREAFLAACGVSSKGRLADRSPPAVAAALLPFATAHVNSSAFEFGTMIVTVQQKVCGDTPAPVSALCA